MEYLPLPVSLVRTRYPASLHACSRVSASARVMAPWYQLQEGHGGGDTES